MSKNKTIVRLADGPEIPMELSKIGILGIHKPVGSAKGYVVTHVTTGKCLLLTRLKRDAVAAQKELEALDWTDLEKVRAVHEGILDRLLVG